MCDFSHAFLYFFGNRNSANIVINPDTEVSSCMLFVMAVSWKLKSCGTQAHTTTNTSIGTHTPYLLFQFHFSGSHPSMHAWRNGSWK